MQIEQNEQINKNHDENSKNLKNSNLNKVNFEEIKVSFYKDYNWIKNNYSEFENLENYEKKRILGNEMHYKVKKFLTDDEIVSKITGMLIDLEALNLKDII